MRIDSIRLKNFRMFRDVTLNKLPNCCIFVGANGTGKTSLFDLFGFLYDALTYNVKQALTKRGGFSEVVSRGQSGPIEFELKFRELKTTSSLVTYHLIIDLVNNRPVVKREILKYRPKNHSGGPKHFLDFSLGLGKVIAYDNQYQEQKLVSSDILALNGLGQLQQFEVAGELRQFIENWHISDIQINEARKMNPINGYNEHLSHNGDNLALFARSVYDNYPDKYQEIMQKMARRVPGLSFCEPVITEDGRILLKFKEQAFETPFLSWQVSDGTISLLSYLLLLHDPNPHSLLCVEEPDNQLYPDILMILAEELSLYALMGESQVFVSTHSPDLLNGAEFTEIFWLSKKDGYTQVRTTAESELLKQLVSVGDLPGALWKQGFFEGAHP